MGVGSRMAPEKYPAAALMGNGEKVAG